MSEATEQFAPRQNPYAGAGDVLGWELGPLCECDSFECSERLPLEAWLYCCVRGQCVVAPGHEEGGRLVEMDGFNVEEDAPRAGHIG